MSATINQAVSSIGGSPNLQVVLTASAAGVGSARAENVLGGLSFNLDYASTVNSPLAQSAGHVNSEMTVSDAGHTLIDLRQISANLYVQLDVASFTSIPGVTLSSAELAGLELLFQGRWFEISATQLRSLLPANATTATISSREQMESRAIIGAISTLIEKTPYTTLANGGYSQTGKLSSVVNAVLPVITKYSGVSTSPSRVVGSYTIAFTMSGSMATGASVSITASSGSSGTGTLALRASLTHNAVPITAPSGATVITPALISQLLGQVRGGATALG